jgi:hypothetical protein
MVDKEIVKEIPQRKKTGVLPATVNLIWTLCIHLWRNIYPKYYSAGIK